MPAFQPSVSLSQSADGSMVVITDTSNYSSNTDGVTINNIISRVDTIQDGLGNPIIIVTFTPGSLTVSITIPKDYYLNNGLAFTIPGPTAKLGIDNYLAANYYRNAARDKARKLRCCDCSRLCNAAVKADLAYNEAVTATSFGVPSEAQNAIDAANLLINSEDCGC